MNSEKVILVILIFAVAKSFKKNDRVIIPKKSLFISLFISHCNELTKTFIFADLNYKIYHMGKGDIKTKTGKIKNGSYGKRRSKRANKAKKK